MFSAAEVESLRICKQTLARQNPELLERMNAEFEGMTDEELFEIAGLPAPQPPIEEGRAMGTDGFDESSFSDRYGTDVTEAATGLLIPDPNVASSDELSRKWEALDRLLGEAEEIASKEAGSVINALYKTRRDELQAPIFDCFNEMEARIANRIPTTIGDCLIPLSLLKIRREYLLEPDELDDRLVDNLLAGVEAMATAGG